VLRGKLVHRTEYGHRVLTTLFAWVTLDGRHVNRLADLLRPEAQGAHQPVDRCCGQR